MRLALLTAMIERHVWILSVALSLSVACSPGSSGPSFLGNNEQAGQNGDDASSATHFEEFPDLAFSTLEADDIGDNPYLGIPTSRRHLLVLLREGASVGDLSDVLATSGGILSGTIPEVGLLQIEFEPDTTFDHLEEHLEALAKHPAVDGVTEDLLMGTTVVPPEPRGNPAWTWGPPAGGNWGLEFIHAPQAWNLVKRPSLTEPDRHPPVQVAVIDGGFQRHPDLDGILTADRYGSDGDIDAEHGTHVAGIIGARWGNAQYADGVASIPRLPDDDSGISRDAAVRMQGFTLPEGIRIAPTATRTSAWAVVTSSLFERIAKDVGRAIPRPRVVNMSLSFNWYNYWSCNPTGTVPWADCNGTLADVQRRIGILGRMFARVVRALNASGPMLFVSAAGNDSNRWGAFSANFPADLASSMNWASIREGMQNDILVAEALDPTGLRRSRSNINGQGVFAPGGRIASTVGGRGNARIESFSGTSMAAPHVTGAAAFLLWLEPTLTNAELRQLLTQWPYASAQPGAGSATSTKLDLLSAALGIDDLRGGDRMLRWLTDIDDGTVDGFTRVHLNNASQSTAENRDDAHGDDLVDMRDFRRLRDTILLQAGETLDWQAGETLDWGSESSENPKRDLNEDRHIAVTDREVYSPENEVYPRAGMDLDHQAMASDITTMMRAYSLDVVQPWPRAALPFLDRSADLVIRARGAMQIYGAASIRVTIEGDTALGDVVPTDLTPLQNLEITPERVGLGEPAELDIVLTTPLRNRVRVRWTAVGGSNETEHVQEIGDLEPGEDRVVVLDSCATPTPDQLQIQVSSPDGVFPTLVPSSSLNIDAQVSCSPITLPASTCAPGGPTSEPAQSVLVACTTTRGSISPARQCAHNGRASFLVTTNSSDSGVGTVSCRAYPTAGGCDSGSAPAADSAFSCGQNFNILSFSSY